jgi:hypothetical protein
MGKLTMEEKLAIANAGGSFQEDANSWVGKKVRKGKKQGVVVRDMNGRYRVLTVRFNDGIEEEIQMDNIGEDPPYIHEYEWLSGEKWYRF